jgi:hypothetical protein
MALRQPAQGHLLFSVITRYAAVSIYSSGRSSNSVLQSSEQKKYFRPAICVWNTGLFFSSTLMPQTGSVVMIPPAGEFVAHTLPDSKHLSVLSPAPSD